MLSVMYVEGINYVDTPNFTNLIEQTQYFNDKVIYDFRDEDYYYPPHYKNSIVVDSGDINLSLRINYLRLDYEGKSYYYFITNVSYNNIGSLILDIEMDVIQTYMFDINFINYKITKRLIERWDTNKINRKYLRNNYSNAVKIQDDFRLIDFVSNVTNRFGWIIAKYNKEIYGRARPSEVLMHDNNDVYEYTYNEGTGLILLPAYIGRVGNQFDETEGRFHLDIYEDNVLKITQSLSHLYDNIHYISELPDITEMYYIKNLPVSLNAKIRTAFVDNHIEIYLTGGDIQLVTKNSEVTGLGYNVYFLTINTIDIKEPSSKINLGFTKNTLLTQPFNYVYVPQLIDENYIEVRYGERINKTTYPLSTLGDSSIYIHYSLDIFTGYRNYWITEISNPEDYYNTRITCNTKELYTMWNDYWKNYMSGNIGSLFIGNAFKFLTGDRGDKISTLVNEVSNYVNLQYKPESYKQGGTFTNDVLTDAMDIIYEVRKCQDIDDVARHYESYGYDVHEVYTDKNIFTDMKTRYYYNYYEVEDMNITLNILNDNTTINNIKDRFKSGIRLWEINNMGDLKLGQVCLYDNVEIKEVD